MAFTSHFLEFRYKSPSLYQFRKKIQFHHVTYDARHDQYGIFNVDIWRACDVLILNIYVFARFLLIELS